MLKKPEHHYEQTVPATPQSGRERSAKLLTAAPQGRGRILEALM